MNAFALPEDAQPYEFPEFPKPEEQVSEYANIEGAVEYGFKDLNSGEAYQVGNEVPVVHPAVFQDFKQVLQA